MNKETSEHLDNLSKLEYIDQCKYIAKKIITTMDDEHLKFLKKLQAIFIEIPYTAFILMKDLKIGYEDEHRYYLDETANDKYFVLNTKKTYRTTSFKRISSIEYVIQTPIKNKLTISSNININNMAMHYFIDH